LNISIDNLPNPTTEGIRAGNDIAICAAAAFWQGYVALEGLVPVLSAYQMKQKNANIKVELCFRKWRIL